MPLFPRPRQRQDGGKMLWKCSNDIGEEVECDADIPKLNPCGENAKTHMYWEIDWYNNMMDNTTLTFPDNSVRQFCAYGEPWRYTDITFPVIDQRRHDPITLQRFCQIG